MESFSRGHNTNQLFKLNIYQLCVICDSNEVSPRLGTGFSFLRRNWIVTAAHVVLDDGLPRTNLYAIFPSVNDKVDLKVIAIHKESDMAILEIISQENPCSLPLYPGYEDFSTSQGLVTCGFNPSQGGIVVNLLKKFSRYNRERIRTETVLEFEGVNIEGGSSGGPIFGDGGVVLGVMTNIFSMEEEPNKKFARAVSIKSLMNAIDMSFNQDIVKVID